MGAEHEAEVYLIGGFVRDLVRKQPSEDLDFIIVGSPSDFASKLIEASKNGSINMERVKEHPSFGTLTLCATLGDGFSLKIDVATSRTEVYPKPADLPVVQPADTIEADIFRRGDSVVLF